jgi:hypothetical protein
MKIIYNGLLLAQKGEWEKAHEIAQTLEGHPDYDRLHAFLHRMEGDEFNAKYWYRRCKIPFPQASLEEELKQLLRIYQP